MTAAAAPIDDRLRRDELLPISRAQFADMISSGIIPDGTPCELLEGVIVTKDRGALGDLRMGRSPRHRLAVRRLMLLAARIEGPQRHLQVQLPLDLSDDSCPEPDAAVVLGADQDFAKRLPRSADVACVIEVAETSIDRDRRVKARIYARAGIRQYILVNLIEQTIEVFTNPSGGSYPPPALVRRSDSFSLQLGQGQSMDVAAADLLV